MGGIADNFVGETGIRICPKNTLVQMLSVNSGAKLMSSSRFAVEFYVF
jgi:hypothetical protein